MPTSPTCSTSRPWPRRITSPRWIWWRSATRCTRLLRRYEQSRSRVLAGNLGIHQPRKLFERLLPAEITGLRRNRIGDSGLHDGDFRADGDLLEQHGDFHGARHVRIVELVGVAQLLVRHQLEILAAEG